MVCLMRARFHDKKIECQEYINFIYLDFFLSLSLPLRWLSASCLCLWTILTQNKCPKRAKVITQTHMNTRSHDHSYKEMRFWNSISCVFHFEDHQSNCYGCIEICQKPLILCSSFNYCYWNEYFGVYHFDWSMTQFSYIPSVCWALNLNLMAENAKGYRIQPNFSRPDNVISFILMCMRQTIWRIETKHKNSNTKNPLP